MSKKPLYLLLIGVFTVVSCGKKNTEHATVLRDDLKIHYDSIGVDGCFVLLNQNSNQYTVYHPEMAKERFIPASTFKIPNTMIGLETGVIKDEHFVIKWDSVVRSNPLWNADHDLKSAYMHSCVWYYQELARRVGPEKMKYWLDKIDYGNKDTAGGQVLFWLTGKLAISPEEQVKFLKRLYENQLSFSKRTMNLTKHIMVQDSTDKYVMRAKTGWGDVNDTSYCWYVGWVETKGNVYYFANMFRTTKAFSPELVAARKDIVYKILRQLAVL